MSKAFRFSGRPAVWVHGAGAIAVLGVVAGRLDLMSVPVAVGIGIGLWTLLEYGLHRFVFHFEPESPWFARVLDGLHLAHHREPANPERLFVRMSFSIPVSALLFLLLAGVTGDLNLSGAVLAGVWIGFVYYEWVHATVHLGPQSRWLRRSQRERHLRHHFRDSRVDFGVTSALWDRLLGTGGRQRR